VITATYNLVAPVGQEEEILGALRIFKGPTEARRECLACAISQDEDDPGVITYLEEWQTAEALEGHIRSDRYRQLLFIIEMSARAPEIRFRTATETKGIEFIEALRGDK
jgi:quinol monooxygenase YgiN